MTRYRRTAMQASTTPRYGCSGPDRLVDRLAGKHCGHSGGGNSDSNATAQRRRVLNATVDTTSNAAGGAHEAAFPRPLRLCADQPPQGLHVAWRQAARRLLLQQYRVLCLRHRPWIRLDWRHGATDAAQLRVARLRQPRRKVTPSMSDEASNLHEQAIVVVG